MLTTPRPPSSNREQDPTRHALNSALVSISPSHSTHVGIQNTERLKIQAPCPTRTQMQTQSRRSGFQYQHRPRRPGLDDTDAEPEGPAAANDAEDHNRRLFVPLGVKEDVGGQGPTPSGYGTFANATPTATTKESQQPPFLAPRSLTSTSSSSSSPDRKRHPVTHTTSILYSITFLFLGVLIGHALTVSLPSSLHDARNVHGWSTSGTSSIQRWTSTTTRQHAFGTSRVVVSTLGGSSSSSSSNVSTTALEGVVDGGGGGGSSSRRRIPMRRGKKTSTSKRVQRRQDPRCDDDDDDDGDEDDQGPAYWSEAVASDQCLRYGTKEYSATLLHLSPRVDPMEECQETPIGFRGWKMMPHRCEVTDLPELVVKGFWVIDFVEGDCVTWWNYTRDKGCISSEVHRYEAQLINLQPQDDWESMCLSTPGSIDEVYFDPPNSCRKTPENNVWGTWTIKDWRCRRKREDE